MEGPHRPRDAQARRQRDDRGDVDPLPGDLREQGPHHREVPDCTTDAMPVLYGIRGDSITEISEAHRWLQSSGTNESSPTFAIHRTNQCSDDHVDGAECGTVVTPPQVVPGGHRHIKVHGRGGSKPWSHSRKEAQSTMPFAHCAWETECRGRPDGPRRFHSPREIDASRPGPSA